MLLFYVGIYTLCVNNSLGLAIHSITNSITIISDGLNDSQWLAQVQHSRSS